MPGEGIHDLTAPLLWMRWSLAVVPGACQRSGFWLPVGQSDTMATGAPLGGSTTSAATRR